MVFAAFVPSVAGSAVPSQIFTLRFFFAVWLPSLAGIVVVDEGVGLLAAVRTFCFLNVMFATCDELSCHLVFNIPECRGDIFDSAIPPQPPTTEKGGIKWQDSKETRASNP